MFSKRFEKDCHLTLYDLNNIINIKTDFIAIDPELRKGNLILLSVLDAPSKLDKLRADYKKGVLFEATIKDENERTILNDQNIYYELNSSNINFQGVYYNFKKTRVGNLSHMIVSQKNTSQYIIRFNENQSIPELVMNKLINIFFIPCKIELVQEVLLTKKEILKEMVIITNNDSLKNIEIYSFNKELFITTLNNISKLKGETPDPIFENFKGDFTGYINYFKPDILENLNSKIEQFYDPDNVPEYITEFPYPLPNGDMRHFLNKLSNRFYNLDIQDLGYEETINVYETYKKMDKNGQIPRDENFNPQWSRQYMAWSAGIEILKEEKMLYASLVMGAGKQA